MYYLPIAFLIIGTFIAYKILQKTFSYFVNKIPNVFYLCRMRKHDVKYVIFDDFIEFDEDAIYLEWECRTCKREGYMKLTREERQKIISDDNDA